MFTRASPSMMNKCECPVRGWLAYHLPKGEDNDAGGRLFGNAVHAAFEQWTLHGTVPEHPALKSALALAMPYLPKPGEGTAEGWVRIPFAPGFEICGKYDHRLVDPELVVLDYKTSTQKPKLQHRDSMLSDPQVQAYCLDALDRHPEKQSVTCTWLNIRVKVLTPSEEELASTSTKVKTRVAAQLATLVQIAPFDRIAHGAPAPVTATFTRAELEARRPQLYDRARKALRVVNADDPRQLDVNKNLCYEYGACDVRQYCDRRNEIMSQPDLLAMMASFKNPAAAAPAAPAAPAATTVNLLGGPAVASAPAAAAQVAQLPVLESPATVVAEQVKPELLVVTEHVKTSLAENSEGVRNHSTPAAIAIEGADARLGAAIRTILAEGGRVSFG